MQKNLGAKFVCPPPPHNKGVNLFSDFIGHFGTSLAATLDFAGE